MIMKLLATYTVYYYKVQTNNRQFLERNLLSNNSFSLYQTPNKMTQKTPSRQCLLTHDRKESSAYNEDEQYKSVVFNRAFPSLYKKLDEQES